MTLITVLGGTGYAGAAIVAEAASRGLTVRAVARRAPDKPDKRVAYITGSVTEPVFLETVVAESDSVISALSPRGVMLGQVRRVNQELASLADRLGFRLGVILGGGSLRVYPDGPLLYESPDFPAEVKAESLEMADVLDDLRATPVGVDWFGVSPAAGFGAFAPGPALGRYRVGGDVLLSDQADESYISAPDLALAVIDEVVRPAHRRQRFTVAY